MLRVRSLPRLQDFGNEESGIKRVVENYYKYLPKFDVEYIDDMEASVDLVVAHAAAYDRPDVVHNHGLYWTADYAAGAWEWSVNNEVVSAIRAAKQVTVPSSWVAEVFQREMRFTPNIVPHGIDWQDWLHSEPNMGYALWNKNRNQDVCTPHWVGLLASAFKTMTFMSTYPVANTTLDNVTVTGVIKHEDMKRLVQRAAVYLSTTKETFGIGVLEALASGVPVLGFRFGGNVDLVQHGVNGYLANPNDIDDLKVGLEYCVKYRNILSANARWSAQKWSWLASAEKVAGVYRLANSNEPATIAIIIPSYNYADKVSRAIESALNQTYPVEQIVVVDDGSTDNTREVVQKYVDENPGIVVYYYQDNAGVANARNAGIALTDTKYICCLDADDAVRPTFVEVCVNELEKDRSLGIAYTGLWAIKPDGTAGLSPWPDDFNYDAQVHGINQIPTCCVFKREMWRRLGGYKQRYAPGGAGSEDAEFWLRAGAYGFNARKVSNEPLFEYSWLSGRVSGNRDYVEIDWLQLHPWTKDNLHPFASLATPKKMSHPVRQYDEPVVSVIIPVGKGHEKELCNALDSLESQTFRKWEVVVVNDTGGIQLDTTAYPYVKVISTGSKPRGAGAARNMGVDVSRSPFILFLDADDWLYPEALDKMLSEWAATNMIVYTDYVGKAFIEDQEELTKLGTRLLYYDQKTHEAVIGHKSLDFDCEKAVRQPDPEMYIWSLISALFPKAWHYEIGGFDEKMHSWEDWDYWIRMAKAGKCFARIPEQLLVYRFYTGNRRERGLHDAQHLIQYLLEKYKEIETMGCGCGKPTFQPTGQSILGGAFESESTGVLEMTDDSIVLISYDHPNRGMHRVIGAATGTDYGYRAGGERFLVDKRDIAANPKIFTIINTQVEAPKQEIVETPPPVVAKGAKAPRKEAKVEVPEIKSAVEERKEYSDLQLIPGVTPTIAAQLNGMGVHTLQELADLSLDDLMNIKGIGKSRATTIMDYANKKLDEQQ